MELVSTFETLLITAILLLAFITKLILMKHLHLHFKYKKSKHRKKPYFKIISLLINNIKQKGDFTMNTFEMQPGQFFEADVQFFKKNGQEGQLETGTVNFFLTELNSVDQTETPLAATTNSSEAGEKHLRVETPADDLAETKVQDLWVRGDSDLSDDGDETTGGDVRTIKSKLATLVFKPLMATGAGLTNATVVADV